MVPYTMAILKDGSLDTPALHAKTWAAVKAQVSESEFKGLTVGSDFRETLFADPAALASQLPLYESKYGYVLLMKAVAVAVNPPLAITLVSLLGSLLTLAVLFRAALGLEGIACLGWFPFVKLFNLSSLSNFPTPDSIATGIYCLGVAAFFSSRLGIALALFIVGVFIRPDNIILNSMICIAMAMYSWRTAGALLVGSIAAYSLDVSVSHHFGWWGQFYYNFIWHQIDLSNFNPAFDLGLYGKTIVTRLEALIHFDWFYAWIGAVILASALRVHKNQPLIGSLLLALSASMVVRFMAYPSVESRLYGPILFGTTAILLHAAGPYIGRHRLRQHSAQ